MCGYEGYEMEIEREAHFEKLREDAWNIMRKCDTFGKAVDRIYDECDWKRVLCDKDDICDYFTDLWDELVEKSK